MSQDPNGTYRRLFPLEDEKLEIDLLCEERMLFDFSKASLPKTSLRIGIKQPPHDVHSVGTHVGRELHLAFNNLLKYNLQAKKKVRELNTNFHHCRSKPKVAISACDVTFQGTIHESY